MLREVLYNQTSLPLLKNALDAQALRQRAIASNIANLESPDYTPRKVTFEDRLARALGDPNRKLRQTNPDHMPFRPDATRVKGLVVEDDQGSNSVSANGVDIERQIADLATNTIHYTLTAKRAAGLFARIRSLTQLP